MVTEIPKDLTKELLTIIFDDGKEDCMQKVVQEIVKIERNELHYAFKWDNEMMQDMYPARGVINLDTLSREMKEWCVKQNYWITVGTSHICQVIVTEKGETILDEQLYRTETEAEFEGVSKVTHWVAKEKGLLKDEL